MQLIKRFRKIKKIYLYILLIYLLWLHLPKNLDKKFKSLFANDPLNVDSKLYKSIIQLLQKTNAFLLNINILEEINSNNFYLNQIDNHLSNIVNKSSDHLVFGVFENYTHFIDIEHSLHFHSLCSVAFAKGNYLKKEVTTNVYFECKGFVIQFAIFYKRGEFYWIGNDNMNRSKWFGDVPRALNEFDLIRLNDLIQTPVEIRQFIFDYKNSKFIECNKKLAEANRKILNEIYETELHSDRTFSVGLKYVKSVLEKNYKHYWLAAGTLIAWYRDCDILSYTKDIDIAMWSHEYERNIKKLFLSNSVASLAMTLGVISDAFEMRLFTRGRKTIDLFLVYQHNETHQWNGYQTKRYLYKQLLPKFNESNICSGELLDNKFLVPCNPDYYLSIHYGANWTIPMRSHYFNLDSFIFEKEWSDEEWPYAVRRYNPWTHELDSKLTLKTLNAYSNNSFNVVPPYHPEFEN